MSDLFNYNELIDLITSDNYVKLKSYLDSLIVYHTNFIRSVKIVKQSLTVELITIGTNKYVLTDDLLIKAPVYFKGSRNSRELIKNKQIPTNQYIYAKLIDGKWTITKGTSKIDKILLIEAFVKTIPELNPNTGLKITDNQGIEKAPNIIHLEDEEKFHDNEGNIIEIETRGEKQEDKIYFLMTDVSIGFDIPNLYEVIINDNSSYKDDIDYKYFICKKKINNCNNAKELKATKNMFLTYEGILRVLYVSRNNKTRAFRNWTTKTLFVAQMGTFSQKQQLSSKLLGVDANVINEVFNTDSSTIPCIYLFTLGTVKDLRNTFNIGSEYVDTSIVAKYGFTKDLVRRSEEHMKTYNVYTNVNLRLKYYSYIDPQYISKGETAIKDYFNGLNLGFKPTYMKFKELVIIPKNMMTEISEKYDYIGKKYIGHNAELITKIKDTEYELEIQREKHTNNILCKDNEVQKEKHTNIVLKKDYDLLKESFDKNNELFKKEIDSLKDLHMRELENIRLKYENELLKLKLK